MINESKISNTFIRQQDKSDCGIACLSSILAYYGGYTTLEKLRVASGTTQYGTTMLGLAQAAGQIGLDAEGFEAEGLENLKELNEPAILHVVIEHKLHHYLVFYGFKNDHYIVGDPGIGIIRYRANELDAIWVGRHLLIVKPNENFRPAAKKNNTKWISRLFEKDVPLLAVILVSGIIVTLLGLSTAFFSQRLIDNIIPSGDRTKLVFSIMLLIIILISRTGLSYLRGILLISQAKNFNNRIIQTFFETLLRLPKSFFDSRKIGDLTARMNDTRKIQTTVSALVGNLLLDALIVVIFTSVLFTFSWMVGIVTFFLVPVYILLVYRFNDMIHLSQKEVLIKYAFSESYYIDVIQGINTIKAFNKEHFFEKMNRQIYALFQDKIYGLGKISIQYIGLTDLFGAIFIGVIFGLSSWLVLEQSITTGELIAVVSMAGSIIPSISRLALLNIQLQEAKIVVERTRDFMDIQPEYTEQKLDPDYRFEFQVLKFNNVSFNFPGRSQLFSSCQFEVNRGESIAIFGESGCGKSTVLQLIQMNYPISAGEILVNHNPIGNIAIPVWRKVIGVVPQDTKIFNGTILYNICLTDQETDFSGSLLQLSKYGFDEFFKRFPYGYATLIGEEGINLSGGEKQVLAIARAVVSEPQLILLDEATSAMDYDTEHFILNILARIKSNFGIIWISHERMPAFIDRVYAFQSGATTCYSAKDYRTIKVLETL